MIIYDSDSIGFRVAWQDFKLLWDRGWNHQEKPQLLIYSYKLKYVRVCEKSGDINCE